MSRPTRALVSLDNLRHNAALAASLAPAASLMAVVKADGYGHGAVTVAAALVDHASAFAVASLEEAIRLRDGGITHPVLLLEGFFNASEIPEAAAINAWAMVTCEEQLHWLREARLPVPMTCWLKIDTGMHRLGVAPEDAAGFVDDLRKTPNADRDIVLCTHFS
ncbi:MAG: alanine racemase, partial [Chromatocurvus sp.]